MVAADGGGPWYGPTRSAGPRVATEPQRGSIDDARLWKPTPASAHRATTRNIASGTRGRSIRELIARAKESAIIWPPPDRPLGRTTRRHRSPIAPRPPLGRRVRANLSTAELVEDAIRAGEGLIAAEGPLVVRTGKHTGRSPAGQVHRRRAVEQRQDLVGRGQPTRSVRRIYDRLRSRLVAYCAENGPLQPGPADRRRSRASAPAARLHRVGLGEHLRAQPVPPPDARRNCVGFEPNFTIICVPSFQADPATEGTRTGTAILLHLERMEIIIVGTEYAGEIKKSAFTVMNYLMPDEGVLPMHSSVNVGRGRRQRGVLRPVGDRQDDAVGRPGAPPDRRRRARLGRHRAVQLRGRLLREDDPALTHVRARHLPDDAAIRDGPRERRPRSRRRASSTSIRSGSPRTPVARIRCISSAMPIRPA